MAEAEDTNVPRKGVEDAIFDKRALSIGMCVIAILCAAAAVWRIATRPESLLRKPAEFEFAVQEHAIADFKIREPVREIVQERTVDMPEAMDSAGGQEERPDIHITTNPAAVETVQAQEVIQSTNTTIDTPRIEVGGTEISIDDAPMEISQVSDTVTYALNPIAADAPAGAPADIFKYDNPTPRDKPATHFINMGPRPGRALRIMPRAFGDQDAPSVGKLGPANINLHGTGEFFRIGSRFGEIKAKSAVDSSLHWLAIHQENDGSWDAAKFEGDKGGSLAVTGLSLLAFMGGGHTTRRGEYTRSVLRGIEALLRNQREDGALASGKGDGVPHLMYTHSICTIALCEACGRARDERIGLAAQRAVSFCEKGVSADGGWRYKPRSADTDMSVTAWFVQALKTAKLAQLKFDHAVFSQALSYVDSVTDQGASKDSNGVVTYQFEPGQSYPSNGHPALTSAGMLIRQFNGMGVKNHLLVKGAELTRARPPAWNTKDFYYWYYATYAMHNMGGEYRIWWNQRIRDVLMENQCREGDNAGSWDPKGDHWAAAGGRVYTTALGALCLEVYYRYSEALTSFGTAPDLDELFFQQ